MKKSKVLYLWTCIDCPYVAYEQPEKMLSRFRTRAYCTDAKNGWRRIPLPKGQVRIPKWCKLDDDPRNT